MPTEHLAHSPHQPPTAAASAAANPGAGPARSALPAPEVSIAILAGGQSRRMGRDKSFVLLDGRPLIEHVLERLAPLALPTTIITNTPAAYARFQLPTVGDVLPGSGSLGGLYTALVQSSAAYTVCVACDMPFLSTALLRHLVGLRTGADVVTLRISGQPEPLHAVYSKGCLGPIRAQIEAGNLRISALFDQVRARYVDADEARRFDPTLRSALNLNTPQDLAGAQGLMLKP